MAIDTDDKRKGSAGDPPIGIDPNSPEWRRQSAGDYPFGEDGGGMIPGSLPALGGNGLSCRRWINLYFVNNRCRCA